MQKVLCFGTFDGVHDGHRAMLREAKGVNRKSQIANREKSNYLIVAVAPDSIVTKLKGTAPKHTSAERIAMLKREKIADNVVLAEATIGTWAILKKYKPTIIALGYDQDELRANLEEYLEKAYPPASPDGEDEWRAGPEGEYDDSSPSFTKRQKKPKIVVLSPHKPSELHSSLIGNKRKTKIN